jgi:hypothetical protein
LNSIDRFCYTIFNNIWSLSDNYALRRNMCSCKVFELNLGISGGLVVGHFIFIPAYGLRGCCLPPRKGFTLHMVWPPHHSIS